MASRLMHLAVGALLGESGLISDLPRFNLGLLLPDAMVSAPAEKHRKSHFLRAESFGQCVMDHAAFFSLFPVETADDPLYLGYYLHLIQDGIYRSRFDKSFPQGVPKDALYRDYRILNARLQRRFSFTDNLSVPADFNTLPISSIAPFEISAFLEELRDDLVSTVGGDALFLTDDWTEAYFKEAVSVCLREITSLREGRPLLPGNAYPYQKRPD